MKSKIKKVSLLLGVVFIVCQSICAQSSNVVPDSLKKAYGSLKALIVVGDESVKHLVPSAEQLAEFLRSLGISVKELHPPYSTAENVIKSSKNVNIFVYKGHGNDGGVICLDDGQMSNDAIAENIKLAPNALVMYNHVCTGAGSSAGDRQSITYTTARDRVFRNARPYLNTGAGMYYANNYYGKDIAFFRQLLLEQKTMYDLYHETIEGLQQTLEKICRYDKGIVAGVSSYYSGQKRKITITSCNGQCRTEMLPPAKSYDIAFVAPSNYTFRDLIKNLQKPRSFLADQKK